MGGIGHTGPTVDADGFLVGEIDLPGGLPPEEIDDDYEPGDDR